MGIDFSISPVESEEDIHQCARMMASMEPFITLKRDYRKLLDILKMPYSERYAARKDGEIIGCAVLRTEGALVGYVQLFVIKPQWQGKGVGQKFLTFLEERIFKEFPNVFLFASSFNNRALNFYTRMGYEVVGELKSYLIKGPSEFLFRKTIAPLNDFVAQGGK